MTDTARAELIDTARAMLRGSLDVVTGCRRLVTLAHSAALADDDLFTVIISFESQTDHLPTESLRDRWNTAALARDEAEVQPFVASMRPAIERACEQIVRKYG